MGLSASRTLDDQRRRRLVMDTDLNGPACEPACVVRAESTENVSPHARLTISLPECVPARPWMYWAFGGLTLAIPVVMLVAWLSAEEASMSGSALGDRLTPLAERLVRGAGVLSWWFAGQLSCLVWWARSRSRVDYSGRFHAWGWTAAGFVAAGMLSLANLPQLAACLMVVRGGDPAAFPVGVTAIWLLPSLVVGLALWATLGIELRGCTASRILHSLTAVSGLAFVGMELRLTRSDGTLALEFAARLSLVVMQWCSLMTVLLQVHRAVHISADPPEARPSVWSVVWNQGPVRLLTWTQGQLHRMVIAKRSVTSATDVLDENVADDDFESSGDHRKRRVRLEVADGSIQEVRIDDAEQLAKGPSRRTRQAARKSS